MSTLSDLLISYNQVEVPLDVLSESKPEENRWTKFVKYVQDKTTSKSQEGFAGMSYNNSNKPNELKWYFTSPKKEILQLSTDSSKNNSNNNLDNNAKYAFNYLVKNGIPKKSAAGIVGNLYHENLANPEQTISDSKGTTSYGIACFNSKGELPNLNQFARSMGLVNLNLDTQLAYLVHVVNTRLKSLKNPNTSTEEASFIFGRDFEKFAGKDGTGRGYKNYDDPEHITRRNTSLKLYNQYKS